MEIVPKFTIKVRASSMGEGLGDALTAKVSLEMPEAVESLPKAAQAFEQLKVWNIFSGGYKGFMVDIATGLNLNAYVSKMSSQQEQMLYDHIKENPEFYGLEKNDRDGLSPPAFNRVRLAYLLSSMRIPFQQILEKFGVRAVFDAEFQAMGRPMISWGPCGLLLTKDLLDPKNPIPRPLDEWKASFMQLPWILDRDLQLVEEDGVSYRHVEDVETVFI